MIDIKTLKQLSTDLLKTKNTLQLKFDDTDKLSLIVDDIMKLIRQNVDRYNSIVFHVNEKKDVEKYRLIESVIHRYMRAAFFEEYEIKFF